MLGIEFTPLTLEIFSAAAFIFCLRVCDVSLGTIRINLISRGYRYIAVATGFIEAFIWVVAISQVINDLGSIWNVLGYSGGFAAGTMVGMLVIEKMALGDVLVRIVSRDSKDKISEAIEKANYLFMEMPGKSSRSENVGILYVLLARKRLKNLSRIIELVDPDSAVLVEDLRSAKVPEAIIK